MGRYFGQDSGGLTNTAYLNRGQATGRRPDDEGTEPSPTSGAPACVEGRPCAGDGDCGTGKCIGRVVDPITKAVTPGKCSCAGGGGGSTTECPEGKGRAYEGCPCGEVYGTKTGKCAPGYVFQKIEGPEDLTKDGATYQEGMIGRCTCQKAISEWKAKNPQGQGLGEYKWPPELMALYQQLMGRAGGLLNREPGIPDDVLNLMFGKNFENVRGQEAGTREQILGNLSSQGMLGTGAGTDALNKTAWNTEGNVGNIKRDLSIYESQKELEDLLSQTDMANKLFGTGAGFNQALEAMNAGRRGEGMQWLMMMMQWLAQLGDLWKA